MSSNWLIQYFKGSKTFDKLKLNEFLYRLFFFFLLCITCVLKFACIMVFRHLIMLSAEERQRTLT